MQRQFQASYMVFRRPAVMRGAEYDSSYMHCLHAFSHCPKLSSVRLLSSGMSQCPVVSLQAMRLQISAKGQTPRAHGRRSWLVAVARVYFTTSNTNHRFILRTCTHPNTSVLVQKITSICKNDYSALPDNQTPRNYQVYLSINLKGSRINFQILGFHHTDQLVLLDN